MTFNPLEHPVCLEFPLWQAETAWAEHIPAAMFFISALRPQILVELGAYRGVSYCSFCQTVKFLKLDTKCYAVDSWQGDEHAGLFGENVLAKLRAHHDPLYADFSRLLQSTFDETVSRFADRSIDFLHIDGFHTYEAVRHDFKTWLPKISERGIVLFHDTNVRERDFGVWKFWAEIKDKHPHFEFLHGHGLGVLAVGENQADDLQAFFAASEAETIVIRKFFRELGARIEAAFQFHAQNRRVKELETYERLIRKSRVSRALEILKNEGVSSLMKKAAK